MLSFFGLSCHLFSCMVRFIAARGFGDEFRVVKIDRSSTVYVTKLSSIYAQFHSVGMNYNLVVKGLLCYLSV